MNHTKPEQKNKSVNHISRFQGKKTNLKAVNSQEKLLSIQQHHEIITKKKQGSEMLSETHIKACLHNKKPPINNYNIKGQR